MEKTNRRKDEESGEQTEPEIKLRDFSHMSHSITTSSDADRVSYLIAMNKAQSARKDNNNITPINVDGHPSTHRALLAWGSFPIQPHEVTSNPSPRSHFQPNATLLSMVAQTPAATQHRVSLYPMFCKSQVIDTDPINCLLLTASELGVNHHNPIDSSQNTMIHSHEGAIHPRALALATSVCKYIYLHMCLFLFSSIYTYAYIIFPL